VIALMRWAEILGWGGGAVGLILTSAFLAVPRTRRNKHVL
jgi:hypothetical protein